MSSGGHICMLQLKNILYDLKSVCKTAIFWEGEHKVLVSGHKTERFDQIYLCLHSPFIL